MEYGYYGPPEWPLASTVASVLGVAMLFGRQLTHGVAVIADLVIADLHKLLGRIARPWLACLVLLALPATNPASPLVQMLRGRALVDSAIEIVRAEGYYEELIRSSLERKRSTQADRPSGWKSFAESGLMEEVHDYRRRMLLPNLDSEWNGPTFRTNALGYRGPGISREKPPGTFRVVVIGSSNTMGHGVEDEESYARLLERWLADKAGEGRRVEVVNLAVSGDSPSQRWLRLRIGVPALHPDWILGDVTALDLSLEEQHLRWVVGRGIDVPFEPVRDALRDSQVEANDDPDEFHRKLGPYLKPLLGQTFSGWAAESGRLEVPLTLVILPRADSKQESPGLFRLLRNLADLQGLRRVDLSDAFDRLELDDYRIAPWDHHPNAYGHRVIFARLRDGLLADPDFMARLAGTAAR